MRVSKHFQRETFTLAACCVAVAAVLVGLPGEVLAQAANNPGEAIGKGVEEGTSWAIDALNAAGGLAFLATGAGWLGGKLNWVWPAGSAAGVGMINVAPQIAPGLTAAMGLN